MPIRLYGFQAGKLALNQPQRLFFGIVSFAFSINNCLSASNVRISALIALLFEDIAKIIALAEKLDVVVEQRNNDIDKSSTDILEARILNFKATSPSSFGDAASWQKEQRETV